MPPCDAPAAINPLLAPAGSPDTSEVFGSKTAKSPGGARGQRCVRACVRESAAREAANSGRLMSLRWSVI